MRAPAGEGHVGLAAPPIRPGERPRAGARARGSTASPAPSSSCRRCVQVPEVHLVQVLVLVEAREDDAVSLPVSGFTCFWRHCAQTSFIMHCIGELMHADRDVVLRGTARGRRAAPSLHRAHHPVRADGDDPVHRRQRDGALAQLALGVGQDRLDDVADEVRGPAAGSARWPTPMSVDQIDLVGAGSISSRLNTSSPFRSRRSRSPCCRVAQRLRDGEQHGVAEAAAGQQHVLALGISVGVPVGPMTTTCSPGFRWRTGARPPISRTISDSRPASCPPTRRSARGPPSASRVPADDRRARSRSSATGRTGPAGTAGRPAGAWTMISTIVGVRRVDRLDARRQLVVEFGREATEPLSRSDWVSRGIEARSRSANRPATCR